eukprot:1336510-Rhodomonas_salina.1
MPPTAAIAPYRRIIREVSTNRGVGTYPRHLVAHALCIYRTARSRCVGTYPKSVRERESVLDMA